MPTGFTGFCKLPRLMGSRHYRTMRFDARSFCPLVGGEPRRGSWCIPWYNGRSSNPAVGRSILIIGRNILLEIFRRWPDFRSAENCHRSEFCHDPVYRLIKVFFFEIPGKIHHSIASSVYHIIIIMIILYMYIIKNIWNVCRRRKFKI